MKGQHGTPHSPGRSPRAVLEKIARVVSGDYTLAVTFAGPPARLDRSGIVLPESMLVDGTLDRMIGTVDLLIARRQHASPGPLRRLPGVMARAIGQVIDDHRCARRLLLTHPGAARFLRARREAERRRLIANGPLVSWEVRYLDAIGRYLWNDPDVGGEPVVAAPTEHAQRAARLARVLGREPLLREALRLSEPVLEAARTARSSVESAERALALVRIVQRLQQDARHNQLGARADPDEGSPAGDDDANALSMDAQADAAIDDALAPDDEGADAGRDDDERAPPDLAQFEPELESPADPLAAGAPPKGQASGAAIEAAVRAARARRAPTSLYSIPLTREFDRVVDHSGRGDRAAWIALRREALKATGRLAEKLERALKAEAPNAWRYEQERGRIHPAALGRLAARPSYRTPFRVERPLPSRHLAISILIDLSASMAGDKLRIAKLCAAAMATALGRLGYPFEILGFSSIADAAMRDHYQQALARGVDMRPFNRFVERLDLQVFKSFAVDDPSGLVEMRCGDQNPDGEALAWAAERLLARRGERHVMFVLSDGHPVTGDGHRQVLQSDLTLRIRRLRDQGVELVGIGVGDDAAASYYDHAIIVRDIAALPTMAFDQLSRKLLGR
ncbi:MAG: VWA domain-containing protein [Burkholderiaceae bacterium]